MLADSSLIKSGIRCLQTLLLSSQALDVLEPAGLVELGPFHEAHRILQFYLSPSFCIILCKHSIIENCTKFHVLKMLTD